MRGIIAFLLWVWTTEPVLSGVGVYRSKIAGRETICVENPLIKLSIIPELGGRLVEYIFKRTDHNLLRIVKYNLPKEPGKVAVTADYAGMFDASTDGWPGPFWAFPYKCEVEKKDGVVLVLSAENEGIRIERRMHIRPQSTKVTFEIKQRNVSDSPRQMVIRLHGEFTAGGAGDYNDYIYYLSKDGVKSIKYIMGTEANRWKWLKVLGWLAMVDQKHKEIIVMRYFPMDKPSSVLYWSGFNEGDPTTERQPWRGFYAIDRFGPKTLVEPGDSISAVEEMFVVSGLGKVDFVCGDLAGELRTDRPIYSTGEKVKVSLTVASASPTKGVSAKLKVLQGKKTLSEGELQISNIPVGGSGSGRLEFKLGEVPDGKCEVVAEVSEEGEHAGIARTKTSFQVASGRVRNATASLDRLRKRIQNLRKKARSSSLLGRWNIKAHFNILDYRFKEAEKTLNERQIKQLPKAIAKVEDELKIVEEVLSGSEK